MKELTRSMSVKEGGPRKHIGRALRPAEINPYETKSAWQEYKPYMRMKRNPLVK